MDHVQMKDILGRLLTELGLPFDSIDVSEEQDFIRLDIASPQASRIIGWHGETLNSIQHLCKAIIRAQEGSDKGAFIVVDVDGYRRMQEEKVLRMADQKADFVRRTKNRIALPPMGPYFRRIVHLHVANTETLHDLTTESTGEGDYRQVVLRLKDEPARPGSGELSPVIAGEDGLENLDV